MLDLRGRCEDLLDFEPGACTISRLSLLDVDALDEHSASVALELLERQQAWMAEIGGAADRAGRRPDAAATGSGQHRSVGPRPIDGGANLVAATLGMTSGGAQARVDTARAITETLPKCQLAMAAGFDGVLACAGGRPSGGRRRP